MSPVLIAFRKGYNTAEIARLMGRSESEIVEELYRARAQDKIAGLPDRQENRKAGEEHGSTERIGEDRST